ncbi:MAG: PQQ-binding-like beta-propeller repeat protein [Polyangiales bacterium]
MLTADKSLISEMFMSSSFMRPPPRSAALLLLGLGHCASRPFPDDGPVEGLSQQAPAASATTTTDFACERDADCARLASSCGATRCDPALKQCTLTATAVEGTACGAGNLCDHVGRCLPCGGAAESTFGLVQTTIFDSPRHGCNGTVCHGGSGPGQANLNLSAGKSYSQMVGVKAVLNPNMDRIRPRDTVNSYVYRKIYWATSGIEVPGGSPMPAGGAPAVPTKLVNALREWIAQGAPETGFLSNSVAKFCEAPCVRNAECSNGNLCDGEEVCKQGTCEPGTPKVCDDGDACTADRCDPVKGCKAVVAPGLPCGAGGVCDEAGSCQTCSEEPASACTLPEVVTGRLTQAWAFAAPASVSSTPLAHEGTVYVTAWNGYVYALDQRTGAKKWELDTQEDQAVPQAVHGGVIAAPDGGLLLGDGNAMVWKLDASGNVLWKSDQQETGADHVWSNLTVSEGLVFVPIASHSDVPCTKGRTVALDLATGKQVWARYNVPKAGVCRTDTAVACSRDTECPGGGKCEDALGGAVTAGITLDPDGKSIYVNTVGCYTFPQVGDTDAMMKLDAQTGRTVWVRRFSSDEQFGYCAKSGTDCRGPADCAAEAGACVPKANYHDFGFINAPLLVDAKDGQGGTRRLLVSGDKSAGVVAVHADTGEIAWVNQVLPKPTTPGFAGYGLFNGKLAHEDGRFFGALYETIPNPNPALDHLMAFSEVDGKVVWSDDIGKSWSSLTAHAGVVYAGTQVALEFYAYNAKTGARLGTYPLPSLSAGSYGVADGTLFVGYGVGSPLGGVRAYTIE